MTERQVVLPIEARERVILPRAAPSAVLLPSRPFSIGFPDPILSRGGGNLKGPRRVILFCRQGGYYDEQEAFEA